MGPNRVNSTPETRVLTFGCFPILGSVLLCLGFCCVSCKFRGETNCFGFVVVSGVVLWFCNFSRKLWPGRNAVKLCPKLAQDLV